jgi:hypothetical protein
MPKSFEKMERTMDDALARHVALATYQSRRGLKSVLELMQNHCSQEEYEKLRAGIALIDQKVQSLLDIVFVNHPNVQRDIADKAQKYGKPL